MTRRLTPEEKAERYCLVECPGGCIEPHGQCMYAPGHLHQHRHSVYDYSGDGSHAWDRELPTKREVAAFLKHHPAAAVLNGKTDDLAEAFIEYLNSFEAVKAQTKKRRRLSLRHTR